MIEEGDTKYVRFGVSMGFLVGHVYPELVQPQAGLQEIQKLYYLGERTFDGPAAAAEGAAEAETTGEVADEAESEEVTSEGASSEDAPADESASQSEPDGGT